MKRILQSLFGTPASRPTRAARPRSFRPGLERLDERLLPSAVPLGPIFDPSGMPSPNQYASTERTVARSAAGNFAVTWEGNGPSGYGIYARLFSAGGAALTGDLHIPGTSQGKDRGPTIGMSSNGQFAVAWNHAVSASSYDVMVERFSATGAALGAPLVVPDTTVSQTTPAVALDGQANLVVTYTAFTGSGTDIHAWYRRAGGASGIFVVASGPKNEYQATVALNDFGKGVVAYTYDNGGGQTDIYARRIDAQGFTVGGTIVVAATPKGEWDASVAINVFGNFVVAYTQAGANFQVLARRYDGSGNFVGQVTVGTPTAPFNEYQPSVSMDRAGHFIVAFTQQTSPGNQDVRAQVFDSTGNSLGLFFVSASKTYDEYLPTVALGEDGRFIVAFGTYGQKHSGMLPAYGVSAQRWHL
jgi:hypothetical protein